MWNRARKGTDATRRGLTDSQKREQVCLFPQSQHWGTMGERACVIEDRGSIHPKEGPLFSDWHSVPNELTAEALIHTQGGLTKPQAPTTSS